MSMPGQKTSSQPSMAKLQEMPDAKTPQSAVPRTDMVMLQKADVWMSQFKTRLNISIIALVLLWGCVSYLKSMTMQLEAHTAPEAERILADGSADEVMTIQAVEGALDRGAPADTMEIEEAEARLPVNATKVAPSRSVKATVAQKAGTSKAAAGKSRPQKKPKKSLVSKSAL